MEESGRLSFKADIFEKAVRLVDLLNAINSHDFLAGKLALKGGTALNLFVFDLPRLSVDIDLNYIGSIKPEDLKKDRPMVEQALSNLCLQKGYVIKRTPADHAGGKWVLGYSSSLGAAANLQLDVNYLYRIPLWTVSRQSSYPIGSYEAKNVFVLNMYELAAGKLKALLSRTASRDLFDTVSLAELQNLDKSQLRLALVVYGAMNPKDWSTVSPQNLSFGTKELKEKLLPVLRTCHLESEDIPEWGNRLVQRAKDFLAPFFPLQANELEFIAKLRIDGLIEPQLITNDPQLAFGIRNHPALRWRALKVQSA